MRSVFRGRRLGRLAVERLEERCVPTVGLTEFTGLTARSGPLDLTPGPDGNIWFTESDPSSERIGRITPDGQVTEVELPVENRPPQAITAGVDGNLWYTAVGFVLGTNPIVTQAVVGCVTPRGEVVEFPLPPNITDSLPGIASGSDGNLWFTATSRFGDFIGCMTRTGEFTRFDLPTPKGSPSAIVSGPDGDLWFTEKFGLKIGRITTAGVITEYRMPLDTGDYPTGLTVGPDRHLWYARDRRIGRVRTDGTITEFSLPEGLSRATGITTGPDKALWFTETAAVPSPFGTVYAGRVMPDGTMTHFPVPASQNYAGPIRLGPDGRLWFTADGDTLGRLDPAAPPLALPPEVDLPAAVSFNGVVAELPLPDPTATPADYRATVYWGDGSSTPATVEGAEGMLEVTAGHTFKTPGRATLGLVLRDQRTNVSTAGLFTAQVRTPQERFVRQLYVDLLRREADAAGLAHWTKTLDEGTARGTIVLAVQGSVEYRTLVVQDLYAALLDRAADPGGLASWVAYLGSGGSAADVRTLLLGSAEYFLLQGSRNGDFLAALYQDALGRAAEPAALAAWSRHLETGLDRATVAALVADGTEAHYVTVQGLYRTRLRRAVDLGGLLHFGSALDAGARAEDVLAALLASEEYFRRFGHMT